MRNKRPSLLELLILNYLEAGHFSGVALIDSLGRDKVPYHKAPVYAALARLVDAGLVAVRADTVGRREHMYLLTSIGRAMLVHWRSPFRR